MGGGVGWVSGRPAGLVDPPLIPKSAFAVQRVFEKSEKLSKTDQFRVLKGKELFWATIFQVNGAFLCCADLREN